MSLHSLKLVLPGQWADGWLYRDHLVLWSTSGELLHISLRALRNEINLSYGHHLAVLAELLIFRSQRKRESDFQDLVRVPGIYDDLFGLLLTSGEIALSLSVETALVASIEPVPGNCIDSAIYGNRVFTASDEGLFEAQFNPAYPDTNSPLLRVADKASSSVVANAGRVSAALGEHGLVSRGVSFGDGEDWWRSAATDAFTTIAHYSRRVSPSSVNLLNYGDDVAPSFLSAHTRREWTGRYWETVVEEYGTEDRLTERIVAAVNPDFVDASQNAASHWIRVRDNAEYRLLVDSEHGTSLLNVLPNRAGPALRDDRRYSRSARRSAIATEALAVHSLASGILVEAFDGLQILTEHGVFPLVSEPRVHVRTFPSSKRYKDSIVSVSDEAVELIGFIESA